MMFTNYDKVFCINNFGRDLHQFECELYRNCGTYVCISECEPIFVLSHMPNTNLMENVSYRKNKKT